MKKLTVLLSAILCLCLLTACAGTPVIYHTGCDCPISGSTANTESKTDIPAAEGELKTGISLITTVSDSQSADGENSGEGKFDATMVAVLVDGEGIIRDCIIDGLGASVTFDEDGQLTSDVTSELKTKNELGSSYGMVAYGGAIAEWDAQAAALADYAVGKTVDELKNGAIDETGKAPSGSDLASSATIYLGGYVSAIEKAVDNATYLGAESGDTLSMAVEAAVDASASADAESAGVCQLDLTFTAITMADGVITSCAIDSVQAKVSFDIEGSITSDLGSAVQTKNELGSSYGMVAYGGAVAEWNEQAAAFAAYVVGKTPDEVEGIAVNDSFAPTDVDISSSVTISIRDFKALIVKAAQ